MHEAILIAAFLPLHHANYLSDADLIPRRKNKTLEQDGTVLFFGA